MTEHSKLFMWVFAVPIFLLLTLPAVGFDEDEPITVVQFKSIMGGKGSADDVEEVMMRINDGGEEIVWDEAEVTFYVGLLKNPKPSHQLAGIYALNRIGDQRHVNEVMRCLKSKDFAKLRKAVMREKMKPSLYRRHMLAAAFAVMYLGNAGDKRAVPILRSLEDVKDIRIGADSPVADALAKLAETKELVTKSADPKKIERSAEAISRIRSKRKVGELGKMAADESQHLKIRMAAIIALGNIMTQDSSEALISIAANEDLNIAVRQRAILVASYRRGSTVVEQGLVKLADRNEDKLSTEITTALSCLNPTKFLGEALSVVADPQRDIEQRRRVLSLLFSLGFPKDKDAQKHKKTLIKCLSAVDSEGRSADKVRIGAWKLLVQYFREFHKVELADPTLAEALGWYLRKKINDPRLSIAQEIESLRRLREEYFSKAKPAEKDGR